ncbi:MAG: hypothetical protein ACPG47_00105 [Leucothrix sp.]
MTVSKINNDSVIFGLQSLPTDGDLANSQVSLYLDTPSKGLFAKWKDDTGTVRSRVVSTPSTLSTNQVLFAASDGTYSGDSDFAYDSAEKTLLLGGSHTVTTPGNHNLVVGSSHSILTGATLSQIACGLSNSCSSQGSWVGGTDVTCTHDNTFIWGSSTAFASAQINTVVFKALGGFGVTDNGASMPITTDAIFQIDSTTKAFMPPRMTTVQRDAITAAEGMQLHNTTTNVPNFYDGTSWLAPVTSGGFTDTEVIVGASDGSLTSSSGFLYDATLDNLTAGDSTNAVTSTASDNVALGGANNVISGTAAQSYALGNRTKVSASNVFAWADSTAADYTASTADSVQWRAGGGFGITSGNSMTLDASAQLQVDSTTQGLLPPRMTTTQRNDITTPAAGLIVYDTTENIHYYYNGTAWDVLGTTETGTHNTDWSGAFSSPATANIKYTKTADFVILQFAGQTAVTTNNSTITSDTDLPVGLRPDSDHFEVIRILDNGVNGFGVLRIESANGNMTITADASLGAFTGSGTGGWYAFSTIIEIP